MSKALGGVVFSEHIESQIRWVDRTQWLGVGQQSRYTLSGDIHVTQRAKRGRTITLEAQPPWCRLTKTTVDALLALATRPATAYTLTWGSASYRVLFDHGSGRAVDLQAVTARDTEPEWSGQIHLIEVES